MSSLSKLKRIQLTLLALGIGGVLSFLVLELLLRLYNPFFARVKGDRIVLQANKRIQFQNSVITGLDRDIVVTRNSLGFRGQNPPADESQRLTIFTVGGSTTQSFMVSDEKTWTAVMNKALEPRVNRIWVNNAGLDGHTTFGHRILLQDQILPRHPKIVTLLVGANDVSRASPNDYDAENLRGAGLDFTSKQALVKSLSTYSEVVALLLNFYRSYTAYQSGLLHSKIDLASMQEVDIPETEQQQLIAAHIRPGYLEAYQKRLAGIVKLCRDNGTLPVLITQPTMWGQGKDDVTQRDLARVKLFVGNGETAWRILEAYNSVTRKVCAAEGVPCIDLAHLLPKSRRLFYDNAHFTVEGNREVGEIVASGLCPVIREKFPQYFSAGDCPAIAHLAAR